MVRLEPRDLVFRPGVEAITFDGRKFDIGRRVIAPIAVLDRELTE